MKHQSMTTDALTLRADDHIECSVDDGELIVFFSASGQWVSDDAVNGGKSFWEHDYTVIGAMLCDDDGITPVFTEAEAEDRFGRGVMHDLTIQAMDAAE